MYRTGSIKEMFQKISQSGTDLIIGTVISESPVKVRAVNDEKLIVTPVVPSRLSDLKKGEQIHMLVLNNGKKYYALDRR